MKGNKVIKQSSKLLIALCLIFAFLISPVTRLFSKITKVFASSSYEDLEGSNVKIEGFESKGTVGERVNLPKVWVNDDSYFANTTSTEIVYDIKTPVGVSGSVNIEGSDTEGYYFIPTAKGVYKLDIYTKSDNKLQTVATDLHINVSNTAAGYTVNTSAVVKDGDNAYVLPSKLSISTLASDPFMLDAPTMDEDSDINNVSVVCIPVGKTAEADYLTMEYDATAKVFKFTADAKTKLAALKDSNVLGQYSFVYSYKINNQKIIDDVIKTTTVVADNSFADDLDLKIGTLSSSSELDSAEIGTWVTLPSANVYDAKSGTTDFIPAIVSIKVTPSTTISGTPNIQYDGYSFKADKLGTYAITYTATYPFTNKTAEKTFIIELKDTTNPEVLIVDSYTKRADYFTSNTDKTEEDYLETLQNARINSIYVLGDATDATVDINIPAIYAKDNTNDGNYTFERTLKRGSEVLLTLNADSTTGNNASYTYAASKEGVYTVEYKATDANGHTGKKTATIAVVKESTINGLLETGKTIADYLPNVTTATMQRYLKTDETLTFAIPTAKDLLASKIADLSQFDRLKLSSYNWSSYIDLTTTIRSYKADDSEVGSYTFTTDDVKNGKYVLDLTEHTDLVNNEVEYFVVETSAKTDWMDAFGQAVVTAKSKNINYINTAADTTAPTIVLAQYGSYTTLATIMQNKNIDLIKANIEAYNAKNGTHYKSDTFTFGADGKIEITSDVSGENPIKIAPFNQHSNESEQTVMLPNIKITDVEDIDAVSITASITDSLGNTTALNTKRVSTNGDSKEISLGEISVLTAGMYTVNVKAVDKGGNISYYNYAFMVNDTTAPSDIVLEEDIVGESTINKTYYTGEFIEFPAAKVEDNSGADITPIVELTGRPTNANVTENIDNYGFATLTEGSYTITYTATDSAGNTTTKEYTIQVTFKSHSTIEVKETAEAKFPVAYKYAWDTESLVNNKLTIKVPYAEILNEVDPSINGTKVTPKVTKNSVTMTVTEGADYCTFAATQGVYTITWADSKNNVSKSITIYVGDCDAPVLTWDEEVPSTIKLGEKWGAKLKDMFTITDVNNGVTSTISAKEIKITAPDNTKTILSGSEDYTFSQEGEYKLTITYTDGVNDRTETKTIKVTSDTTDATTNTSNVVGTILLIASILVVGGVIVYLIVSSKKKTTKSKK